jgi:predicted secreted protein
MATNGGMFIVKATGLNIYGAKSDDIEVVCGTNEVVSPTQGSWREFIAGRKEWQVTTNYLVQSNTGNEIDKILNVGIQYPVMFIDSTSGHMLAGQAIMVSAKISAIKGNLVTGSFQFKGTGALNFKPA